MFNEITWKSGEKLAQEYMRKNGYKILETNFSCVGVELDIVALLPRKIQIKNIKRQFNKKRKTIQNFNKKMLKSSLKSEISLVNDMIVITEVKSRTTNKFGTGVEAITNFKKANIIRGARYLSSQPKYCGHQFRFDVASIDDGKITYIENAF